MIESEVSRIIQLILKTINPNGDYGQPDSDYSKFSNEYSSERTVRSLDYYMQPPPRRFVNTKCINMSTNKKRDINDKLKEYQSIIDNFILSKSNLLIDQ